MQVAEFAYFEDESVVKKFPAAGIPPSILAQTFRLVQTSLNILSDEGVYSTVENGVFVPPLSKTAKKFVIYGDRAAAVPSPVEVIPAVSSPLQAIRSPISLSKHHISMQDTKDEIKKIILKTCNISQSVQLLSSVPQTCLLLDSVQILVSCTQDVKLEVDTNVYNYLKKSTTFKAELFRCTNEIRDTFFNCGLAMNTMQSLTSDLPSEFASLISVVANPQNPELRLVLELSCESIREASAELVKVSEDITNQINDAQTHLQQLIIVAIEKQEESNAENNETAKQINACKTQEKELRDIQGMTKETLKAQLRHRDKVYANYGLQLQNYQAPSLPETVFRLTGDALSELNDAISTAVNSTASAAKNVLTLPFHSRSFTSSIEAREVSEKSLLSLLTKIRNEALENMEELDKTYQQLIVFLQIHMKYDPCTKPGRKAQQLAEKVLKFLKSLKGGSDTVKPSVLLLQEPLKTELTELKVVLDATLSIVNEVKKLNAEKEEAKKKEEEDRQKAKAQKRQKLNDAKKYALDLAKENYEKENKRAENLQKELSENQEKIMQIATKMATLNLKTLELKDVIKILNEAKMILVCISNSWMSILQFFKLVKANIDGQFKKNLTKLLHHTDLFMDLENRELLPRIVKTMMMTIGSCIQFKHCAQIYGDILTKHTMPVMNNMTNSMVVDQCEAQDSTNTNETKEVPAILENFAKRSYSTLEIDVQADNEQTNVFQQVLTYLKIK
uniref:Uncharacterized protein n=1 Tax=Panagrolaimus davidi TaxID=227884 RepID=A0A914QAZ7_9BILA